MMQRMLPVPATAADKRVRPRAPQTAASAAAAAVSVPWSFARVPASSPSRGGWEPGTNPPPSVGRALASPGESIRDQCGSRSTQARVHRDADADIATRELGAAAFSIGRHIVVRSDQYPPITPSHFALLEHELGYVRQSPGQDAEEDPQADPRGTETP